jgi:hypothetical protein
MNTRNTSLRQTVTMVFVIFSVYLCLLPIGRADIVGKVETTDCLQTDKSIDCKDSLTFINSVSYGLTEEMEVVTLTGSPAVALEETIKLEMTKSRPSYYYPLTYFHTVAYYPHEETISSFDPDAVCNRGCDDSGESECPTCGWVMKDGKRVEDSQGFCGDGEAHCLRAGTVLFHGYEIGTYHKDYEISIKMTQGSEVHVFKLRPDNPSYITKYDANYPGNFLLGANLLGDQEEYTGVPELGNFILYIPAHPNDNDMVKDYQNNMLLVPREAVSKDGMEADKVGVSYDAFRMLGSAASLREPGDGLGNQLFHLHNFDLQKLTMNPNAETTYLVHGQRVFKRSMEFKANMEKVLVYRPPHIQYSLVSIKTDKATLKEIETESKGSIISAQAETISSMSNSGVLNVLIKNIGAFKTDYIVTVTATNSTTGVVYGSIPAQARTLEPLDEVKLSFDIFTHENLEQATELLVSLKGEHGKIYETVIAVFNTVKHPEKEPWELYMENKASKETTETKLYLQGDHNCDDKVNFIDFARLADKWNLSGNSGFGLADLAEMAECWLAGCQT